MWGWPSPWLGPRGGVSGGCPLALILQTLQLGASDPSSAGKPCSRALGISNHEDVFSGHGPRPACSLNNRLPGRRGGGELSCDARLCPGDPAEPCPLCSALLSCSCAWHCGGCMVGPPLLGCVLCVLWDIGQWRPCPWSLTGGPGFPSSCKRTSVVPPSGVLEGQPSAGAFCQRK